MTNSTICLLIVIGESDGNVTIVKHPSEEGLCREGRGILSEFGLDTLGGFTKYT